MESQRIAGFGTTVFTEFSRLAAEHGAVNLGQGFPDFDGPDEIKDAAIEAIRSGGNQYAVTTGAAALRQAVAAHARRFYGQAIDPDAGVAVTSGATEAIFDAVLAFVNPGDEVVLFEPFYDSYVASVAMAGGIPRYVPLQPPDTSHATWWFDPAALAAAFSDRTRLVMVNTPHNPTGKVFTRDELLLVGQLARRHGAVLVSDEVYEHLVFPPAVHVRPATLPGLEELTLTLSSAGKTFSFTGWKIGWVLGAPPLVRAAQKVHQFVTFATAAPLQAAVARALALPDAYFRDFVAMYQRKRDLIVGALRQAGLEPLVPEGTYFAMARTDRFLERHGDDVAFCRWLTTQGKVAAIPPSFFYGPEHRPQARNLARFAFCKTDGLLEEAARRLGALPA